MVRYTYVTSTINDREEIILQDETGEEHVIPHNDNLFMHVLDSINSGEPEKGLQFVLEREKIRNETQQLTKNIKIQNNEVHYKNEILTGELSEDILNHYYGNKEITDLLNFTENLMKNPSYTIKTQLYSYLKKHNFILNNDGSFYAYIPTNEKFTLQTTINNQKQTIQHTIGKTIHYPRNHMKDTPNTPQNHNIHIHPIKTAIQKTQGGIITIKQKPQHITTINQNTLTTHKYETTETKQTNPTTPTTLLH